MTLGARTQALLALVEEERERQCAALENEALAAAAVQRASSRADARLRLREAFAEERTRCSARVAQARAELRTRQRLHEQRHLEAQLALAWQGLRQQLAQRWQDAHARRAWVGLALSDARRVLPSEAWQMHHAPGLQPDEQPAGMACRCDPRIGAGLRIVAAGNVLDATLEGLLADRADIGGRLVGLLQQEAASAAEGARS